MKKVENEVKSFNPPPVSRGLKLQNCFIGLDSLYLVVEYPKKDVFDKWTVKIDDFQDIRLNAGIAFNGKVLKRGLLGYKLSVWDEDARLLITDRVEENLQGSTLEGQGMGVMLQLGPKWLRKYGDKSHDDLLLNIYGQLLLLGIQQPEKYPIRLNRIDIAIDILGIRVADFSTDEWRNNWVGYANKMSFHTDSRTRNLQGFSIGSSEGAVRFKVYDKVAESNKRGTSRFWRSVWNVDEDEEIHVARFEWTIKSYGAKFSHIQYLEEFSEEKVKRLINYASFKWGRLSIPQEDDTNRTRWPVTPLWAGIQEIISDWKLNNSELAHREYEFRKDISDSYLNSIAGWLAGSMVRVGLEHKERKPVDLTDVLLFMQERGLTLPELAKRASKKWEVASKLA